MKELLIKFQELEQSKQRILTMKEELNQYNDLLNDLVKSYMKDSLESTQMAIIFIKALGLQNTQESINYLDQLNKLSVTF